MFTFIDTCFHKEKYYYFRKVLIEKMKELVELRMWMDIHKHDFPNSAVTTEHSENGQGSDTDQPDLPEPAAPLTQCYSSLSGIEKKFVDRIIVAFFVNRLMTAEEKVKGVSAKLKPNRTFNNIITLTAWTDGICKDKLLSWSPDGAKLWGADRTTLFKIKNKNQKMKSINLKMKSDSF